VTAAASDAPGVWGLHTAAPLEEIDLHLARLTARGVSGAAAVTVSEDAAGATVWLPVGAAPTDGSPSDDGDLATHLDRVLEGTWERVAVDGWDERWRATIQPVRVGPFVVTPPWKATGGAQEIVIEPAQAFGTGHHETTTGCLQALAAAQLRGRSVLDVGTGTGILAIAAARLGAAQVVACDTDPVAARTAQANAVANGAEVDVLAGSLDAVPAGAFDVVVANLDTATVVALARPLVDRCTELLVVSGVSNERRGEALEALRAAGMTVEAVPGREWTVVTGSVG
jgi:ribosomal protein L11 methyltransferase